MCVFPIVQAFSPAKINLHLDIFGQRKDGFHELSSLMHTIDLKDFLTIRPSSSFSLHFSKESSFPTSSFCYDLQKDSIFSTIYEEAKLFFSKALPVGCDLTVTKNIPIGAGLGGGSSNIAAFLLSIALWTEKSLWKKNRICFQDFPLEKRQWLWKMGEKYGSDVVFFFDGGLALATGRGEKIVSVPCVGEKTVLIYYCGDHISTKTAYGEHLSPSVFAEENVEKSKKIRHFLQKKFKKWQKNEKNLSEEEAKKRYEWLETFLNESAKNDFLEETLKKRPILSRAWAFFCHCVKKSQNIESGKNYLSMTGSGSSLYVLFHGRMVEKERVELQRFFLKESEAFVGALDTKLPAGVFLTRLCGDPVGSVCHFG